MTRLLIVDDNPQGLYMLQALLSASGFEVETASNGAEALEKARRAPPDMIISDILMPVMDGFSLCRAWKQDERLKDIPFVFYTATYTDPKDEDFALSLGAERFIVKPIEPDKFLTLLRETIETHKAGKLVAPREPIAEEAEYYEQYSAALVRKLEDKMLQLEEKNRALEAELVERRRAEEQLSLSEARLRATLYSIGDAVITTDVKGRVMMMNPVAEKLTGWSEADAQGKPLAKVFRIVNEKTHKKVENPVARILREGVVIGLANHTLLIARDGTEYPIADAGAPIRDARGEIAGVVLVFRDQSAERAAQRAVEEARLFAKSIVATVREPLVVLDADLRVVSANRAFYRTFQVAPQETEGRHLYELGNRQWDIPELRRLLEDILPQNTEFNDYEVRHRFERIGERIMWLNARRIYREGEKTQLILLAIEDVTEREQAEEAYRTLVQHSLQGFCILQNGRVVFANPALAELSGYTVEELLAFTPAQVQAVVHPEDRDRVWGVLQKRLAGEPVAPRQEFRFLRKDGEVRWVEVLATRIEYRGQPAMQAAYLDITERKQAEEALRKSEQKYASLFHQSVSGIYLHDLEGRILDVNEAACRQVGYSREELLERTVFDLHPPESPVNLPREEILRQWSAWQPGQRVTMEVEHQRKDGTVFPVEISTGIIALGEEKLLLAIVQDITERKRAEEKITEQLAELQQWYEATLGREGRILELKREVNELARRLGEPVRYPSAETAQVPGDSNQEISDVQSYS